MLELDLLDKALHYAIDEKPGSTIADIIRPFLRQRSETALRHRIRALELSELIRAEKTKHGIRLYAIIKPDNPNLAGI